jgi:hypothetical protein
MLDGETSDGGFSLVEQPCRILEIIAPAGFERFFAELVHLGGAAQADPATLGELCERYWRSSWTPRAFPA